MGSNRHDLGDTASPERTIDSYAETVLRWTAQRSTRRSLLGRMGKIFLVLAGAGSAVDLVLRDARVSADGCGGAPCSDWRYCGMSGIPCASCPGGTNGTCPCGDPLGSWTYCCQPPGIVNPRLVTYRDCCGCSPSNCTGCCTNQKFNPKVPGDWCFGAQYGCTLAIPGSVC